MTSKKILILYAPCGAGHEKAAKAIYEYFKEQGLKDVVLKDILDFAPAWYRKTYRDGYYLLTRRFTGLWHTLYKRTEKSVKETIFKKVWRKAEKRWFSRFYRYLAETKPSVVLSAHFLPIALLEGVKRDFKLDIVVTDYYAHRLWVSPMVDNYFVASEMVKTLLVTKGIPAERILVTGIPITPIKNFQTNRYQIRRQFGLDEKLFTVLLLSGAGGVGDIESIIRGLEPLAGSLQLMVNTGLNEKLRRQLEKDFSNASLKLKIFGFTDDIYNYYYVSDMVISKPGGLTITECLSFGLPIFMIDAIPGQEEENAKFVASHKAGVQVKDIIAFPGIIKALIDNQAVREEMRHNALKIAPKNQTRSILEAVFQE
jgi:processive 1,2-diacylglycerol beta-glucosyltransferase